MKDVRAFANGILFVVINPLTDDAVWRTTFAALPPFDLPDVPVLVVAPHPDDETLGAGALIATLRSRGIPVSVVAATDGENAYEASSAERRALGLTRSREQQEALAALGVEASSITRLHLTDSGLTAEEEKLTDGVRKLVEPGMMILAPWAGDFHPDHEACARSAAAVAKEQGLGLISYFFWTWHRGTPELLDGLPLFRFDPDPEGLAAKTNALLKHGSQLEHANGAPILPERLLAPARWPFEVFLTA